MLPSAARLLRLLSLLQSRRFWTGADLAERLEATDRTLRRDVERLRSLGYPVHSTSGVAGGYQLGAGAALPPLQLDDEEALAVSIALGTAATGSVSGIDEGALRALVKLEQVLPARLRDRAEALRATIVPLGRPGAGVSAATLSTIARACRDHHQLCFAYADHQGNSSDRRVEPQGLVHTAQRWYLVAWDSSREDFRTFRIDRVGGELELGACFTPRPPPEGGDLRTYVSRSLSTTVYGVRAQVILHAPFDAIAPRVSPSSVLLEPIDAKRCRFSAGGHSSASIIAWLLTLEVDFEIEEPAELAEQVRALHARLGRVLEASRGGRVRGKAARPSARRR